jgi:hypothetical protein
MASRTMNMPVAADVAAMNAPKGGGGGGRQSGIYKPLPIGKNTKGQKFDNKLYVSLFNPAAWDLHRSGENGEGYVIDPKKICNPKPVPDDLWTWYWKLEGHYVPKPGQTDRNLFIVCPKATNKNYVEVLKYKPLFVDDRCAFCDHVKGLWDSFDVVWKTEATWNGASPPNRFDCDKELYNKIVTANPKLGTIRKEADNWRVARRFIFVVFDISKMMSERPLDEGQESLELEIWPGPKAVFDGLNTLFTNGKQFWDLDKPELIIATKDCTKGGDFATYTVMPMGVMDLDADTKAYLGDDNSLPKVSSGGLEDAGNAFALCLTYDEQRAVLAQVYGRTPAVQGQPAQPQVGQPAAAPFGGMAVPQQMAIAPAAPPPVGHHAPPMAPPQAPPPAAKPRVGGGRSSW